MTRHIEVLGVGPQSDLIVILFQMQLNVFFKQGAILKGHSNRVTVLLQIWLILYDFTIYLKSNSKLGFS